MFPEIFSAREARRAIDGFVDDLVVNYADTLTAMSQPFLKILVWIEQLLRGAPWWSIILAVVILAYLASRRVFFSLSMGLLLFLMGSIGLWDAGMETLALMIMATALSVLVGIPLGIITGKSKIVRSVMLPLLDVMQTLSLIHI